MDEPIITRTKIAEDELSILWEESQFLETDEQIRKAAEESACGDFWPLIESYADECDEVLAANGFPRPLQIVHDDGGGRWRPIFPNPQAARERGEQIKLISGHKLVRQYSDGFSDAWYAAHIGLECRLALDHWRKSDGKMAFLFEKIFQISAMRKDWIWRQRHKRNVIVGRAVKSASKLGGRSRGKALLPRNTAILMAMDLKIKKFPDLSISRIAALVAREGHGTSADANRKLWQRHRVANR